MRQKTRILIYILAAIAAVILGTLALLNNRQEDKPESAQEHIDLGRIYLTELSYEKAVLEFTEAIEIEPLNADAYLGLAESYAGMGDVEKAVEILEEGYDKTGDERLKDMLEELNPTEETTVTTTSETEKTTTAITTKAVTEITSAEVITTSAETTETSEITVTAPETTTIAVSVTTAASVEVPVTEKQTTIVTTTVPETTTTEETTEEPEIDFYKIAEKYVNDSEFSEKIVLIEKADYDSNGKTEAFFIEQGKVAGMNSYGTHLINSKGEIIDLGTFFDDVYDLYDAAIYEYKNYKFFCVERCYNDEATDTTIYTIKNGNWHRPNISGNVRLFSIKNNVITCEKKGDYINGKIEYIKTELVFDEETCEFSYEKIVSKNDFN